MYDFYVVLGCFGFNFEDFVDCPGVENVILKVNSSIHNYNEMMSYFDQCRLFDRPIFDLNAVRHIIFNLQNRYDQVTKPLWSTKRFDLYQKFIIDHRQCGPFIKLQLPADRVEIEQPEKVLIVPEPKIKPEFEPVPLANNLRLVRGKR